MKGQGWRVVGYRIKYMCKSCTHRWPAHTWDVVDAGEANQSVHIARAKASSGL